MKNLGTVVFKKFLLSTFLGAITLMLFQVSPGYGFVFNVTNDTELRNALMTAQNNDEDDTINIDAGTYDASGGNPFVYDADATENQSITILGDPGGGTVLDGGNDSGVMDIITDAGPDDMAFVLVRNLTIQNGSGSTGLDIDTDDAEITVEQCVFINNNSSSDGGGLEADGLNGNILISSNLFLGNSTDDGNGGGFFAETDGMITVVNNIAAGNDASAGEGGGAFINSAVSSIVITNNTVFGNTSEGNGGGLSILLDDSDPTTDVYNNIVYMNMSASDGDDIAICQSDSTLNLFNNDFIDFFTGGIGCGNSPVINQGANINADPQFVNSGADDFHLTVGSPAIDTGDPAAPSMPSTDFDGNPRPAIPGTNPDMGALEFQPTPTPSPTPTATPTPTPPSEIVQGSGGRCSLDKNMNGLNGTAGAWIILSMAGVGLFLLSKRSATSKR